MLSDYSHACLCNVEMLFLGEKISGVLGFFLYQSKGLSGADVNGNILATSLLAAADRLSAYVADLPKQMESPVHKLSPSSAAASPGSPERGKWSCSWCRMWSLCSLLPWVCHSSLHPLTSLSTRARLHSCRRRWVFALV